MAHPLHEVEEEILIRLNVKDLIRCKSVCKSWSSLISSPRFVKTHLNRSYDKDRNDKRFGCRRITMVKDATYLLRQGYDFDYIFINLNDLYLIGSSNGLVCVNPSPRTPTDILVINPSTREVEKVTRPLIPATSSLCWGFGYESSKDDYKLVLGFKSGENCTCFHLYSMRSKIWKVIGEITYVFTSRVSILCEGALHWLAYNTLSQKENVILSFNFSGEKFLEVPKPNDVRCKLYIDQPSSILSLGTIEERLCLIRYKPYVNEVWVMKDYNKQQSWEMLGQERDVKYELVHNLKLLTNRISSESWLCQHHVFLVTPIYVESLVSPRFMRNHQEKDDHKQHQEF